MTLSSFPFTSPPCSFNASSGACTTLLNLFAYDPQHFGALSHNTSNDTTLKEYTSDFSMNDGVVGSSVQAPSSAQSDKPAPELHI
ncbi:hypothetical protein V6N11_041201 [Hibiscus sabdariffa]|uniref:Uncharacterized protein n=1 Tax=Hibiscus sabdariffa TaxID=183260 RepID=A0ABR2RJN3_9ROSI